MFPAPETSYTTQSAFGQVIYLPRNLMQQVNENLSRTNLIKNPKKPNFSRPTQVPSSAAQAAVSKENEINGEGEESKNEIF